MYVSSTRVHPYHTHPSLSKDAAQRKPCSDLRTQSSTNHSIVSSRRTSKSSSRCRCGCSTATRPSTQSVAIPLLLQQLVFRPLVAASNQLLDQTVLLRRVRLLRLIPLFQVRLTLSRRHGLKFRVDAAAMVCPSLAPHHTNAPL